MKKVISFNIAGLFIVLLLTSGASQSDDPNGKAGASGAPGETTCNDTDCHNSFAVNSGIGSVTITSPDLTDWAYAPGNTYTISVTVEQSSINLFGLCFEALKSNGDNAGTLHPGTGTQIKNKTIGGFQRKAITHNTDTGASANTHTFTFTWDAPATAIGDITFYVSGLAANDNGNETGDRVYNTSQVVTAQGMGLSQLIDLRNSVSVFPNPCVRSLSISQKQFPANIDRAKILNLEGQTVLELTAAQWHDDGERITFDLVNLARGSYMLGLSSTGRIISMARFEKQ